MIATYVNQGTHVNLSFSAEGKDGVIGFTLENPTLGENVSKVLCSFDSIPGCIGVADSIVGLYITKMDVKNRILSGRFTFNIPCKEDLNRLLYITERRFDMYMRVLGE